LDNSFVHRTPLANDIKGVTPLGEVYEPSTN
jgi:hypothetical protein